MKIYLYGQRPTIARGVFISTKSPNVKNAIPSGFFHYATINCSSPYIAVSACGMKVGEVLTSKSSRVILDRLFAILRNSGKKFTIEVMHNS